MGPVRRKHCRRVSQTGVQNKEGQEGNSCDKRFRTYFGKAKKTVLGYYAVNECGIYVADESMEGVGTSSVGKDDRKSCRKTRRKN